MGKPVRANPNAKTFSGRFMSVLENAYRKTGRGAVVLIDEYDKPLLQTFHDKSLQDNFRNTLMAFYTVLKDADPYLRFASFVWEASSLFNCSFSLSKLTRNT